MPSRWFTLFDTLGWLEGMHLCACVYVDGRVGGGQGADSMGGRKKRELVGVMKKI